MPPPSGQPSSIKLDGTLNVCVWVILLTKPFAGPFLYHKPPIESAWSKLCTGCFKHVKKVRKKKLEAKFLAKSVISRIVIRLLIPFPFIQNLVDTEPCLSLCTSSDSWQKLGPTKQNKTNQKYRSMAKLTMIVNIHDKSYIETFVHSFQVFFFFFFFFVSHIYDNTEEVNRRHCLF